MVTGIAVAPESENAGPVTERLPTLSAVVPLFSRVTVPFTDVPTTTLPKAMAAGEY
jgi:hypothetical protein